MAKHGTIPKKLQIDKANARIVIVLAASAFISTFCLVSARSLLGQRSYQSRVIKEKTATVTALKTNLKTANTLVDSYKVFVSSPNNIIGGNPGGTGDKDGDNAKIILDALPSKYDFPALASSLEKILLDRKFKINAITGSDDELAQGATASSPTPVPIDMPFQLSVTSSYDASNVLLDVLNRTVRPFQISQISLGGSTKEITLTISGKTFYQPAKDLNITTKVVQ